MTPFNLACPFVGGIVVSCFGLGDVSCHVKMQRALVRSSGGSGGNGGASRLVRSAHLGYVGLPKGFICHI